MRADLIRDLFQHLDCDGSLQVGNCPNEAKRTLEEMALPLGLKRVLQGYWTNSGGKIGGYTFYSVEESLANQDLSSLMAANMFPIGYAANGDPLVLCFNDEKCAIGLVSHDQFWEENTDPNTAYAEVTASIDELLWRAAEGRYLLVDYYAASELLEMRKEISTR
ncbi:MAG TPA: hypothetical protein VJU86_06125 [Pyrinomonadaceae bacterium]|nr:hypothetical protein [Pyrinomonadaceae bacterium]